MNKIMLLLGVAFATFFAQASYVTVTREYSSDFLGAKVYAFAADDWANVSSLLSSVDENTESTLAGTAKGSATVASTRRVSLEGLDVGSATSIVLLTIPSGSFGDGEEYYVSCSIDIAEGLYEPPNPCSTIIEVTCGDNGPLVMAAAGGGGGEGGTVLDWDHPYCDAGTAAEMYGLTGDIASLDGAALATWAKNNGVAFADADLINKEAFLLNCENTAAAIAAAKAAFVIQSVVFDGDGIATDFAVGNASYNGELVLKGCNAFEGEYDNAINAGTAYRFFKACICNGDCEFESSVHFRVDVESADAEVSVDKEIVCSGQTVVATVTPTEGYTLNSLSISVKTSEDVWDDEALADVVPYEEDGETRAEFTVPNDARGIKIVATCMAAAKDYPAYVAEGDKSKYDAWVEAVEGEGNQKIDRVDAEAALQDAYLLNVAPAKAEAEAKALKCTSITVSADGTVTVTASATNTEGNPYNGTITIKGSATLNGEYTLNANDSTARFFKAYLK